MPLGQAMLRVSWQVYRQLSIIAACLPCTDELSETGVVEALEWVVERELTQLRERGVLTAEDERYIAHHRAGLIPRRGGV